jgi:hypothetical protein
MLDPEEAIPAAARRLAMVAMSILAFAAVELKIFLLGGCSSSTPSRPEN